MIAPRQSFQTMNSMLLFAANASTVNMQYVKNSETEQNEHQLPTLNDGVNNNAPIRPHISTLSAAQYYV